MFGDALFPPIRMSGKWIRCTPKDECTFDLLRVFTGFDLGTHAHLLVVLDAAVLDAAASHLDNRVRC